MSIRRAFLTLAQFSDEQLPVARRAKLTNTLVDWYQHDPDPGYPRHRRLVAALWAAVGKAAQDGLAAGRYLAKIDRNFAGRPAVSREWYVTKEDQTMVIVRGPAEFVMGSPSWEPARLPASDSPDERQRRVRIGRSFAISSKKITIAQFRRFLDANPSAKKRFAYVDNPARMAQVLRSFSPDDGDPQIAVSWYEAKYCNWLSQQEGVPESEWVYPTNVDDIKDGMQMPDDYLHRTGYRLLTEAEWECAARAGSTTSRFYGAGEEMLEEFALYSKHPPRKKGDSPDPNDPQRTQPVGQLKPNDLGIFDVYGKTWH